jgi:hypothetical protein
LSQNQPNPATTLLFCCPLLSSPQENHIDFVQKFFSSTYSTHQFSLPFFGSNPINCSASFFQHTISSIHFLLLVASGFHSRR